MKKLYRKLYFNGPIAKHFKSDHIDLLIKNKYVIETEYYYELTELGKVYFKENIMSIFEKFKTLF